MDNVGFPVRASGKASSPPMQKMLGMRVQPLHQEVPLEKRVAAHSSILAWEIPWTERNLVGYCPWSRKELDTTVTEHMHIHHLGLQFAGICHKS